MRVGEKIYCRINIKNYVFNNSSDGATIFAFQDERVEVMDMTFIRELGLYKVKIKNSKGKLFTLDDYDYFYTEKEMRKKKLDKIDEL